jgi:hypothetical protein
MARTYSTLYEMRNTYTILVGKPEDKIRIRRSGSESKHNIKINL